MKPYKAAKGHKGLGYLTFAILRNIENFPAVDKYAWHFKTLCFSLSY